jgi:hypothetical protein
MGAARGEAGHAAACKRLALGRGRRYISREFPQMQAADASRMIRRSGNRLANRIMRRFMESRRDLMQSRSLHLRIAL